MRPSAMQVVVLTGEGAPRARRDPPNARTIRVERFDEAADGDPTVVIIDETVEKPTAVGRRVLRRWPAAKVMFLSSPDALPRLQASLPFIPELAGSVALSSAVDEREFARVLEQLAAAAEHDRSIGGLYQRLNTRIEALGANRAALQQRQRQLVLAERYLATVLDHAPQALIATDLAGGLVTCNHVASELLGVGPDSAGLNVAELFAPESRAQVEAIVAEGAAGRTARGEATVLRDGLILTVDISAAPVLEPNGSVAGLSLAASDVTERRRVEAALADANRRLNAVLDNATVAIFLMDDRQQCAYMNDAAERLTGYTWAETRGRPLHDVIHHTRPDGSHYPLEECPIDRAFPENHQQQGEDVFVHKDGRFYPVAFTASPIRDEESRTIGTIIEVRDISEEKRNQEARELLMREVDHRARNVLTIAQSMIQLTRAADVPRFKEVLVGRIRALARAQSSLASSAWQGARLRDVIEDELGHLARPGAYDIDGPNVMLRAEQVQPVSMIVHELATNAAKYGAFSTELGRLSVRWSADRDAVRLEWSERGVGQLQAPTRRGFGSRLINDLSRQLEGAVEFDWAPTGLRVVLVVPLSASLV